jgi:SAM-dependent methyltransferase
VSETGPLPVRALDSCAACGGSHLKPLPLVYEFRGSFPLVECDDCGLRFLAVQPTREGLASLYDAAYFVRDFRCGRCDVAYASEDAFQDENDGLLDEFERLGPRGRLLELGCAGGWLLRRAIRRGWRAQGVELSVEAAADARALGLHVQQGDLLSAALPADSFDLVYMGDVLEHVPDCRATLAEAARLLRQGGHLYLRGPITTHSLARRLALALYGLRGRVIVLREPPYHLWEFTPGPLEHLFASAGLDVVTARQSKIPPGRAHGEKSPFQRLAMFVLDALNLTLTGLLNVAGDRIVMVGRKSG